MTLLIDITVIVVVIVIVIEIEYSPGVELSCVVGIIQADIDQIEEIFVIAITINVIVGIVIVGWIEYPLEAIPRFHTPYVVYWLAEKLSSTFYLLYIQIHLFFS